MNKDFKNIYSKNNLDYNCNKLFGSTIFYSDYLLSKNKKNMYCIKGNNKEILDSLYCEIDSYSLFQEIIKYGKIIYEILKDDLHTIKKSYKIPINFDNALIKIVSEESIDNNIDDLFPICVDLCNKYSIPFSANRYFPVDYKTLYGVPILYIVNHILLIYSLNLIYIKLSKGYKKYTNLYRIYNIKDNDSDFEILNILIEYINIFSLPYYNLTNFTMEISMEDNKPIPITVTSNMFSYAFEVIQNNVASLSFFSEEEDGTNLYIGFRKCSRCLKNISDELETTKDSIPKIKQIYCNECKKELKKISSNKYEHKLSTMYKELKEHQNECPLEISNQIKLLSPREKLTLNEIQPVYNQFLNFYKK